MRTRLRWAPLLALILALAACGPPGPDDVALEFMSAVSEGDLDTAMGHMSSEINVIGRDKVRGMLQMSMNQVAREGGTNLDDVSFEVVDVVENERTATVTMVAVHGGEKGPEQEWEMVKEDGEWKISLGDMGEDK